MRVGLVALFWARSLRKGIQAGFVPREQSADVCTVYCACRGDDGLLEYVPVGAYVEVLLGIDDRVSI